MPVGEQVGLLRQYRIWSQYESFERVIMVDALHHVYNHARAAAELWRFVKPGGRIVIEEENRQVIQRISGQGFC